MIFTTNAHGGPAPVYAIWPNAKGELKLGESAPSIAWSIKKGGSYMSTPVVYQQQIYLGNSNGVIRAFDATNGEAKFEHRFGRNAGVIASLVAGDGKIYCASENRKVYVLKHGSRFELIAENLMDGPCLASPAISEGILFIRTAKRLTAIRHTSQP